MKHLPTRLLEETIDPEESIKDELRRLRRSKLVIYKPRFAWLSFLLRPEVLEITEGKNIDIAYRIGMMRAYTLSKENK